MSKKWPNTTIGVMESLAPRLKEIQEALAFQTEMGAYKFCLSYAILKELPPANDVSISRPTKWNMGSFDGDGEIETLFDALYPKEANQQLLMVNLAEAGIEHLHQVVIEEGATSLSDVMDTLHD